MVLRPQWRVILHNETQVPLKKIAIDRYHV